MINSISLYCCWHESDDVLKGDRFLVVVPRVLLDSEKCFDCWENVVF